MYSRNRTSYENFNLKLCTCAQSLALGTRTNFQLGILTINVICGIVYFHEIILESWWNVSEITPWSSGNRPGPVMWLAIRRAVQNLMLSGWEITHGWKSVHENLTTRSIYHWTKIHNLSPYSICSLLHDCPKKTPHKCFTSQTFQI